MSGSYAKLQNNSLIRFADIENFQCEKNLDKFRSVFDTTGINGKFDLTTFPISIQTLDPVDSNSSQTSTSLKIISFDFNSMYAQAMTITPSKKVFASSDTLDIRNINYFKNRIALSKWKRFKVTVQKRHTKTLIRL